MKCSAAVLLACMACPLLISSACNYAKPMMYVDVENRSGHPMEDLEVKYPTGSFGLPELRDDQTNRQMVPFGEPCKFRVAFQDQAGKAYVREYDFGAKCPTEVAFEVDAGMSLSQRVVRP